LIFKAKNDIVKCKEKIKTEEMTMSKVCEVCGRGKMTGKQVSFSNKKYNRTYELNLQKTTIEVDGKEKTVKACTKCIRTAKKA